MRSECFKKIRFFAGLIVAICGIFFWTNFVCAAPVSTFDSVGKPTYLEEDIEKTPDHYLLRAEVLLREGKLAAMGIIVKRLSLVKKDDPKVSALLSLFLASENDMNAAKTELAKAKLSGNSAYVLYAEAMVLRLEKKIQQAKKICMEAIAMDENHPYPWNVLGRIQFDQGKIKNAHASFQKALRLEPNFLPGYLNLGAASYMLGDDEAAINNFKKAIQMDPRTANAHYGLGLVYAKIGQYKEASGEFLKTIELDPENHLAIQELGSAQLKANQPEKALETGKKMEKIGLPDAYLVLGDAALHLGKTQEAIQYLEQASPDRSEVDSLLGFCYMVQNQNDTALTYMETALKKNPNNFAAFLAQAGLKFILNKKIELDEDLRLGWGDVIDRAVHFSRGCVQAYRGNWETATAEWGASENLIKGFSIKGLDAQILSQGLANEELPHLNLGMLYFFRQLYDPALEQLFLALDKNADSILSNYFLAQVYLNQGDRSKAIGCLNTALKHAPNFFTALYSVAEINFLMGNPAQALDFYLRALEVHKDPGILLKVALYYENAGKLKEAEKYYEDLINAEPELYVGYNQLAWFYAKQGKNLEKALGLARKANVLMPGNASILDTLGWIHYHNQQYDKALEYLEHSEKVISKNPTVLFHIGLTYFALGENNKSYAYLEKALELNDQFEGAEKAKEILESRNP